MQRATSLDHGRLLQAAAERLDQRQGLQRTAAKLGGKIDMTHMHLES